MTVLDRLMAKVEIGVPPAHRPELGPCWLWTGATNGRYGQVRIGGRLHRAHRAMLMVTVGPIRRDRDVDHLCSVRLCVNPAHLEVVTRRENLLRGDTLSGVNSRKTHCDNGHEFTPENTYVYPSKNKRRCRTCDVANHRLSNAKRAARGEALRQAS